MRIPVKCGSGQFKCRDGGCIDDTLVCDGMNDCNDARGGFIVSDEVNCGYANNPPNQGISSSTVSLIVIGSLGGILLLGIIRALCCCKKKKQSTSGNNRGTRSPSPPLREERSVTPPMTELRTTATPVSVASSRERLPLIPDAPSLNSSSDDETAGNSLHPNTETVRTRHNHETDRGQTVRPNYTPPTYDDENFELPPPSYDEVMATRNSGRFL